VFHAKAAEEHAAFYPISRICAEIRSRNRKRYSSWSCFSWNCRQSFEEIAPERAVFFYSQNPGMEVVDDVKTSISSWDRLHHPFGSVLKGLEASSPVCFRVELTAKS